MDNLLKNLLQNPEELTEKDIDFIAFKLHEIYRKERRKTIAQTVYDVLTRANKNSICGNEYNLMKICYLASNSKLNQSSNILTIRKSIYNGLKNSKLFRPEHVITSRINGENGMLVRYYINQPTKGEKS